MRRHRDRRAPARGDAGAAALEFALVLPVLALILFAVIDFGIFFANSIDANSGVQEATRQAVVGNFDPDCTPPSQVQGGPSADIRQLMCMVSARTSPLTGDTYVKVVLPTDATHPDGAWTVDEPLTVCEIVVPSGVVGFVPLPDGGQARSKAVMTIEQPSGQMETGGSSGPADLQWSWCTAS